MATLRLGSADQGAKPTNLSAFFSALHEPNMKHQFREERDDDWCTFREDGGQEIRRLQARLRAFGFLPHGEVNGIFDYRTQSAARLFQEYVRSVEGHAGLGAPDGLVGPRTQQHLDRWQREGRKADWVDVSPQNPTPAYRHWMRLLGAFKAHYLQQPGPAMRLVQAFSGSSDTRPVQQWDFSPAHVHLVGIRRGAEEAARTRYNNDVFVLLAGGLAFTFFGSTDPNPKMSRADQPFLVPGQHLYRFGWHKRSDPQRTYRAFRPAGRGVLVVRDSTVQGLADALDEADFARGIDQTPNPTINIHWSGRHTGNWSAGCQVIAGGGYLNHHGDLIDCWDFAAVSYGDLPGKTRGAYNVLVDLATVFSKDVRISGGSLLHYTLIEEDDLRLEPALATAAVDALKKGIEVLRRHDRSLFNEYAGKLGVA